jgi:hypothetical protein
MSEAIFNRDKFGINQKYLAIGTKYFVRDIDTNEDLLYVERDRLGRYTHSHVFTDKTKAEKVLHLEDKATLDFFGKATVVDVESGRPLASLKRDWLISFFWRETYDLYGPGGFETPPIGKIESRGSGLRTWLRKFLKFFPFFRLQFDVFLFKDNQAIKVMEYNRKASIRDHYVVDCTFDTEGLLDRKLAVGLGLILDSYEAR